MRRPLRSLALWGLGWTLAGCPASGPPASDEAERAAAEAARVHALFAAYFEEVLERNPVFATLLGDRRYNDRLPNFLSPAYLDDEKRFQQRWLDEVGTLDRDLLSSEDRLSVEVFVYERETALADLRFPGHLIPISQFFSLPSLFAQMGSGEGYHPFETEKDYRDFLARMDGWVALADQAVSNMRQGIDRGVVQPKAVMEKVLPQLAAHLVADVAESVFYRPLNALPEEMSAEAGRELRRAYAAAIREKLIPSYRRLHDFIRDEYLPRCRETVALSALPDGEAWYLHLVGVHTTGELTPEEIHRFGEEEVERITAEMNRVIAQVGFEGNLRDFFRFVETDERFYYTEGADLIQAYEALQQKINRLLPSMFDLFPKFDYEVREVPAFMAESSSGAFYQEPAADGSRPGVFYVNTFNLRAHPKFIMESLSLHEASPGHHFQISIAQELESLPRFRRFGGVNAYFEGWALYCESLGKELGLFTDPFQYYGMLTEEMLRAMRLVVDTGLHHRDWTREQAIAYMLEHSSLAETDVVAEVERYIAMPGQALAYKVGQRSFANLRAEAERALGDRFEVKAFHRAVLADGALPLEVLERKMDEWLERTVSSAATR